MKDILHMSPAKVIAAPPFGVYVFSATISAVQLQHGCIPSFIKHDSCRLQTEVWLEFGYAPWMIKPIFGFISDAAPILGERRRPYLVICGLLCERSCITCL